MWDTTFLATMQWPPMESMDYIEPDVSETLQVLYKSTTQALENNLHNNHRSSNLHKSNNNNHNDDVEK